MLCIYMHICHCLLHKVFILYVSFLMLFYPTIYFLMTTETMLDTGSWPNVLILLSWTSFLWLTDLYIMVLALTPQSLHHGISTLFPLADHDHPSIANDLPHFYFILNFYCLLILAHPFISHTNIYCQCPPAYWSGCRGPWALRIFFILISSCSHWLPNLYIVASPLYFPLLIMFTLQSLMISHIFILY